MREGDSVAVNGCCLTATDIDVEKQTIAFDLLEQTLRVTGLGDLRTGDEVNIERALRAGDRLGGHFVQGHVDATAEILHWGLDGTDYRLTLALPPGSRGLVIPKGSICLDGISLTAAEVTQDQITCWIIPHTHAVTNLHTRKAGQRMNVEFDMLGKYVDNSSRHPGDLPHLGPSPATLPFLHMNFPVDSNESLDTHRKALKINLDTRRYGTFAEIGAGQEVVRWFFRVGGGRAPRAFSTLRHDVSDAIYGKSRSLRGP